MTFKGFYHSEESKYKIRQSHLGKKHPNWKGGRKTNSKGYIQILMPDHHLSDPKGYVYEHRLIIEKKLGRYLMNNEIVHHIDHDRQNNREDNLQVMTRGQHTSLHNRSISTSMDCSLSC